MTSEQVIIHIKHEWLNMCHFAFICSPLLTIAILCITKKRGFFFIQSDPVEIAFKLPPNDIIIRTWNIFAFVNSILPASFKSIQYSFSLNSIE